MLERGGGGEEREEGRRECVSECRRWRRERKSISNAVPRLEEKDLLL